jgi:uncharacterized Zn finger protein
MSRYYDFPEYVSVHEKRARAAKTIKQLQKKNPNLKPVVLDGKRIATTWWGKEWNSNLERYADYSNRIGRGRSYVRHNAVLHLDITPGKVEALVQGSGASPYKVDITIKPISKSTWEEIKRACKGKLRSLQALMGGKFPEELARLFTEKGAGLFPSPKEISFDCSCPDWASMCKHVAAVLYGIGSRLDHEPDLFFILRKADKNDLISEAVIESKNDLLEKAARKSSRVIDESVVLSEMFGIDLDDAEKTPPQSPAKPPKKAALKKAAKTPLKTAVKKTVREREQKKSVAETPLTPRQIREEVEKLIRKKKGGIPVSDIIKAVGLAPIKIRNAITRLRQLGKIEPVSRGAYRVTPTKKQITSNGR